MRRITKLTPNKEISDYVEESINLAQPYLDRGEEIPSSVLSRYNYGPLKDIIVRETSGKCVYCESKILMNQPGELDHMVPKSKFISDKDANGIYNYSNLTLSCNICNNTKKSLGTNYPLLSPYTNKPERHIYFVGPMIFHHTPEGRKLILSLNLDQRDDLVTNLRRRLREIDILIKDLERERDEEIKTIIRRRLKRESLKDKEYSLAVFNFLRYHKII